MEAILALIALGALFGFLSNLSKKSNSKPEGHTSVSRADARAASIRASIEQPRRGESNDEALVTFRMFVGSSDEEQSSNTTPGRWIGADEVVTIAGRTIEGGMVYVGGVLSHGYHRTEASLIDDTLDISQPTSSLSPPVEDDSLSYWPRFIAISPQCRGYYLDWLASKRNDPAVPISYVFLYFYGLERRVCVDAPAVSDSEYKALFQEVVRLLRVYGAHWSFRNYATRLLELMCIERPGVVSVPLSTLHTSPQSLLLRYLLGTRVEQGHPIPADLALAWLKYSQQYALKTPARRCEKEFETLFRTVYERRHGEGIVVKRNKTPLRLFYAPASGTLEPKDIDCAGLPDPSALKTPVNKLIQVAEQCTELLNPYSRYLGKQGTSKDDLMAVLLLPDELSPQGSPIIRQFQQWANDAVAEHHGVVDVSDFWAHTGLSKPSKINKPEAEILAGLARKAGYGMAPDSRYHHAKPSIDGKIVLFDGGHDLAFEPSRAFNQVGMILRLGAMIAAADNRIEEVEVSALHRLIDQDISLSAEEKRSLHAYLLWRLNTPANMSGLKARIAQLGATEKKAVSDILVGIALADGQADPEEIKALQTQYKALGLDDAQVTRDIHHRAASYKAAIASSKTTTPQSAGSGFNLNADILALHESQTNEVKDILGSIFVDEEAEAAEPANGNARSLDTGHASLVETMVQREQWPREEVEALCDKLGLMLDGALELINDWAYDSIDAPLLDDDGEIYVDMDIAKELGVIA